MDKLIKLLKTRIENTDLAYYSDKDGILEYALKYAISMVNNRRGFKPTENEPFEQRYEMNVLEGAVWYLAKIGAEGYSSTSENGVSVSWKELPEWLSTICGGVALF